MHMSLLIIKIPTSIPVKLIEIGIILLYGHAPLCKELALQYVQCLMRKLFEVKLLTKLTSSQNRISSPCQHALPLGVGVTIVLVNCQINH